MQHDASSAVTAHIDAAYEAIMADGYVVLKSVITPDLVAQINDGFDPIFARTPFCVGGFYGEKTKRFGSLLRRSTPAAALIENPLVIGLAERILSPWCDSIQPNLGQAIEVHPGALPQFPHRDQDMWQAPTGKIEYLVNILWPLTPFRGENGATRIWPGSHGENALLDAPTTDEVAAECDPTDAIIFLGSTLHGAGANLTDMPRRGIIVSYCLGWLKPYENQWLVYPPEIARTFPPSLARLVGYRQHRPNLGNVEGQCPSILLSGQGDDILPATDALRPEQEEAVAAYVSRQRESLSQDLV